jgi:hypothetical protein
MFKENPYGPEPVEVIDRGGTPVAVTIKKRRLQVKEIANIWRIDEEWWRKTISRLYFLLELENGMRLTIFHDLQDGNWYRQGWA